MQTLVNSRGASEHVRIILSRTGGPLEEKQGPGFVSVRGKEAIPSGSLDDDNDSETPEEPQPI